MKRFSRRFAYTLVEILVVTGIILILGALLFPVFSRVREKGRAVHCENNLHQLALAFQQYSSDNGTFPSWYNAHQPTNPLPSDYPGLPWGIRIQPYVKDQAIFQCPSDNSPASSDPMASGFTGGYSDYSYNLNLSSLPDSKVSQPAEVVMTFDGGPGAAYNAQSSPAAPVPAGNGDLHSGGANFAFVDGHVKWIALDYAQNKLIVH